MITRFIVLFAVALLSLFSPITLAQNSCTDSDALNFQVTELSNARFKVEWYADYNCTTEYRVCWNGTVESDCLNKTVYYENTAGSMDIDYPHDCRQLSLSLEAFPNPPFLNDTVMATTTIVTAPEQVQNMKLSQPFGKPTVRVEWLYWVPESHCSSNFIVTWCDVLGVCKSKSVERNASSYDIENLEFCAQYTVAVRAEDKANNHTSDSTTQYVSVDQARNLEVTSINSTSAVLKWAPRNVSLCTDGSKVCIIQSNLTEVSPTCYVDLKSTDTSITVIGLQPSLSYNFSYSSSYNGSVIPLQTLDFVETPSGVSRTSATYFTALLLATATILFKHLHD